MKQKGLAFLPSTVLWPSVKEAISVDGWFTPTESLGWLPRDQASSPTVWQHCKSLELEHGVFSGRFIIRVHGFGTLAVAIKARKWLDQPRTSVEPGQPPEFLVPSQGS